jgi:asparagine synthase (glutamine-hydrolysing)
MSVQYGRWNFNGRPIEGSDFTKAQGLIAPYGPDGIASYQEDRVAIAYGAFHTTKESRAEKQPHRTSDGIVITWDGRLDNREELIRWLSAAVHRDSTDIEIVAAAHEKWGPGCFGRISGDWALSIWNPHQASVILAKDVLGARPLFYALDDHELRWSSLLEPLVLIGSRPLSLNEEYVAGWFSFFPATNLTPYAEIESVRPASYVLVKNRQVACREYWKFDPAHSVRYATDEEYEEHFRSTFAASIRRRLRSDAPVTAELSGGMDSSSIVCMADQLISHADHDAPQLDTISYYDDAEPNWNERPYFASVEQRRGRKGCHLSAALPPAAVTHPHRSEFRATPTSRGSSSQPANPFADYFVRRNSRVLLSGIGGDEVLGGVPTPIPELADLLTGGKWEPFVHQTTGWALALRKPWVHLLLETARRFLSPAFRNLPSTQTPPAWVTKEFARRHRDALQGYERRLTFNGVRPSFQVNMFIFEALRRQLACTAISSEPLLDERYPYLDRELLQFLYAIPREQLVRPHQRRSLMRRALRDTVPGVVLNRRRKAYASRNPLTAILSLCESLIAENDCWTSARMEIVDQRAAIAAVQRARSGENLPLFQLSRTLSLESWLRGFIGSPPINPSRPCAPNLQDQPQQQGRPLRQ